MAVMVGTAGVSAAGGREFVAEFEDHALGGLFADAGNASDAGDVVVADGSDHFVGGHAAEDGDGELWTDAAYCDQLFEELFFGGTEESVERDLIFADVSVDVQGDLAAEAGQVRECWNGDGDVVAYAGGFDYGLVGMLG